MPSRIISSKTAPPSSATKFYAADPAEDGEKFISFLWLVAI
jgi:hypothetical protein